MRFCLVFFLFFFYLKIKWVKFLYVTKLTFIFPFERADCETRWAQERNMLFMQMILVWVTHERSKVEMKKSSVLPFTHSLNLDLKWLTTRVFSLQLYQLEQLSQESSGQQWLRRYCHFMGRIHRPAVQSLSGEPLEGLCAFSRVWTQVLKRASFISCLLQEHEKRCWSVDFNLMDPKLLASGSDDAKGNWAVPPNQAPSWGSLGNNNNR